VRALARKLRAAAANSLVVCIICTYMKHSDDTAGDNLPVTANKNPATKTGREMKVQTRYLSVNLAKAHEWREHVVLGKDVVLAISLHDESREEMPGHHGGILRCRSPRHFFSTSPLFDSAKRLFYSFPIRLRVASELSGPRQQLCWSAVEREESSPNEV
jgi:hypothetical protein